MTIQPQEKLTVDLLKLLSGLDADVTGEFAEGSVAVYFEAASPMPLLGQLTIANPDLDLVYESRDGPK